MAESFKLAATDLGDLRHRLLQMGPDYEGATAVIQAFLTGMGYGISHDSARAAAEKFGQSGCSLESIRNALSGVAYSA